MWSRSGSTSSRSKRPLLHRAGELVALGEGTVGAIVRSLHG